MSQYPSPYSPPPSNPYPYLPYGVDPSAAALLPARRAGALMIVVGSFGLLCGTCLGMFVPFLPSDPAQLPPELVEMMQELSARGITLRQVITALAVLTFVPALLLFVLGFFVRKGGRGAIYSSIVVVGLLLMMIVFSIGSGLAQGRVRAEDGCISVTMLGVLTLIMIWLVQAARNAPQVEAVRAQQRYAQQWPQWQQQQQMYGQGGYPGYAPPAPPPPGYGPPAPPPGQGPVQPPTAVPPPPPPPQGDRPDRQE